MIFKSLYFFYYFLTLHLAMSGKRVNEDQAPSEPVKRERSRFVNILPRPPPISLPPYLQAPLIQPSSLSILANVASTTQQIPVSVGIAAAPAVAPVLAAAQAAVAAAAPASIFSVSANAAKLFGNPEPLDNPEPLENPEALFDGLLGIRYKQIMSGSDYDVVHRVLTNIPGCELSSLFAIENPMQVAHYNITREYIARECGGNANCIHGYHCTSPEGIRNIMVNGFMMQRAKRGNFGFGAYFTESFLKANDYSTKRRDPNAIRVMLICEIICGNKKKYEPGIYERSLLNAPPGFHSVEGEIIRDKEIVVYNSNQILPKFVVFYKFGRTDLEINAPTISHSILKQVQVTVFVKSLFEKLMNTNSNSNTKFGLVKNLIHDVCSRIIDVKTFLKGIVENKLIEPVPDDLESVFTTEFSKCILTNPSSSASLQQTQPPRMPSPPPRSSGSSILASSNAMMAFKAKLQASAPAPLASAPPASAPPASAPLASAPLVQEDDDSDS